MLLSFMIHLKRISQQKLYDPKVRTIGKNIARSHRSNYNMSGQRAPDKHDNCQGWSDVKHYEQDSGSMVAQYAPKGKGKSVTASSFTQPGTPTDDKRWESDMQWLLHGERQSATVGNAVATNDRRAVGIISKDFAKRS